MRGLIDMNIGVFWDTSAGFLKCEFSHFFSKYSQSYVKLNLKSSPKFNNPYKLDGTF